MHRHPQVSAWQPEEDGSYQRELDGYTLRVHWHPESADKPRGFSWKIDGPDVEGETGMKREGEAVMEEIEHAMLAAEDAAHRAGAIGD